MSVSEFYLSSGDGPQRFTAVRAQISWDQINALISGVNHITSQKRSAIIYRRNLAAKFE
jgi:hypothetical protein